MSDSYTFTIQAGDTCDKIYPIIAEKLGSDQWRAIPLDGAPELDCANLQIGASYKAVPL